MTVQEFMRSYNYLGLAIQGVVIVTDNEKGEKEVLYPGYDGYDEHGVQPEVLAANVHNWGITANPNRIWISVEPSSLRKLERS